MNVSVECEKGENWSRMSKKKMIRRNRSEVEYVIMRVVLSRYRLLFKEHMRKRNKRAVVVIWTTLSKGRGENLRGA